MASSQSRFSGAGEIPGKTPRYATRGQEFRITQSLELPIAGSSDPKVGSIAQLDLREAALRGTPVEKVHFLTRQLFLPTPDFVYVTDTANQLIRHARLFDNPGGMRIVGAGGTGKDAIIRYLQKQHPSVSTGKIRTCPIVVVTFDSYLAPKAILGSMLRQLDSAYKEYQDIESLEDTLREALEVCLTEALVFNEAHHMLKVNAGSARSEARLAGHVGDWVKRFLDKTPLPAFFFGVPGLDDAFTLDGQLGTRIPNSHPLPSLNERALLGVLKALDEAIPMPEPAGLTDPTLATPIAGVAQGNWRRLMTLLRDALFVAAEAGARRIEMQDLSYSYSLHFGSERNPFGGPRVL